MSFSDLREQIAALFTEEAPIVPVLHGMQVFRRSEHLTRTARCAWHMCGRTFTTDMATRLYCSARCEARACWSRYKRRRRKQRRAVA